MNVNGLTAVLYRITNNLRRARDEVDNALALRAHVVGMGEDDVNREPLALRHCGHTAMTYDYSGSMYDGLYLDFGNFRSVWSLGKIMKVIIKFNTVVKNI